MSNTPSPPYPQTSRKRRTPHPDFTPVFLHQPSAREALESPTAPSTNLARQDSFSPYPNKKPRRCTLEASIPFGERFEQALRAQVETHSYECALSASIDTNDDYEGGAQQGSGSAYETQATIPLIAVSETQSDDGQSHIGTRHSPGPGSVSGVEVGVGTLMDDNINAVLTAFTYRLATLHVSISSMNRARRKAEGALTAFLTPEVGRQEARNGNRNRQEGSTDTDTSLSTSNREHDDLETRSRGKKTQKKLQGLTHVIEMAQAHLSDVLVEREALRDGLDEDIDDQRNREVVVKEAEKELRRLVRRYEERLFKMLGELSPEAMRRTVAEMGSGSGSGA
ncbi:hypothetical protein K491DRAFT_431256 [Lophiostoma macrostomum CBS 122681]|uniref:Uncharacterized protein n=1 Tax=Lophiostoma macrostomum CBS 122681 TaxID=1314788 RepID=A0A6A6T836_9PLEO|nr:hypothetical protein K491DRAFT_431256 [Lophiostoma macrostomum CBS 122681]